MWECAAQKTLKTFYDSSQLTNQSKLIYQWHLITINKIYNNSINIFQINIFNIFSSCSNFIKIFYEKLESFHPRYFKTLIKSLSNRSNLLVLIKADLSPITKWKLTGLSYYSNVQNPQIHPSQIPWSKNLLILTFHFSNFKKYLKTKSFNPLSPHLNNPSKSKLFNPLSSSPSPSLPAHHLKP